MDGRVRVSDNMEISYRRTHTHTHTRMRTNISAHTHAHRYNCLRLLAMCILLRLWQLACMSLRQRSCQQTCLCLWLYFCSVFLYLLWRCPFPGDMKTFKHNHYQQQVKKTDVMRLNQTRLYFDRENTLWKKL